jgi:transposase InsO family protein
MAPAIKKVSKSKESITKWIKVDINEAHELLGHVGERSLRDTAKTLEWDLTGHVCTGCTEAKAKAAAVAKNTTVRATRPGERLFTDISGPYAKSAIGSRYWIMVVDDYSRMKWSFFRKNKSDIGEALEGFLVLLSGLGYATKYLRCDDAGENTRHLSDLCKRRGIKIEFTTRHTPQLNGVVERAFVTVCQRAKAMMFSAQFTPEYQGRLWAEAVNTATVLTNTAMNSVNKDCPSDMFYGDILPKLRRKYADFKEFGRIGHVTIRTKVKKLDKKTFKGVFLGYSTDHAADTYRMYNPETNSVVDTRDVTWTAWHGSNNPLKSMEKLYQRTAMENPMENADDKKVDNPDEKNQDPDLEDDDYELVDPPLAPISDDEDDGRNPTDRRLLGLQGNNPRDSEQSDGNPGSKAGRKAPTEREVVTRASNFARNQKEVTGSQKGVAVD